MRPQLIIPLAVLALALLGLGGLRSWRGAAPRPLASGAEASRVEIRRPREDLILVKSDDGAWVVEKHDDLADAEAVARLLSGLRGFKAGAPVAPPEGGLAAGLGPADSARVRVLDAAGRPLFDGLFGRRLLGRSSYFRSSDRDPVRVAAGPEPELLLRAGSQWREPRLLPGGCPSGVEVFARRSWRRVADAAAERELCALRASHWATGTPEGLGGFDTPLLRVRTPEGSGFTVGERRGVERLARVDGRKSLLRIPAAAIEAAAADLISSPP